MQRRDLIRNLSLGSAYLSLTGFYSIDTVSGKAHEGNGKLYVRRPSCELPIIHEADIVVIGGSTAGVTAAWAAAGEGAKVFLVSGEPYLGYDICSTYRFWDIKAGGNAELESRLFGRGLPTPNDIKNGLEDMLLERDIPFVLCSYVSNILADVSGAPAGVVIANRSGEQVIRAGIIIDATERGTCARLMGASFTEYPAGDQIFDFTVLGNEPVSGYDPEKLAPGYSYNDKSYNGLSLIHI